MKLFAFQVPKDSNMLAFAALSKFLLDEVGGASSRVVHGAWRDEKTGQDHIEEMFEVHVMCDKAMMFDIQQKLFELWPNEICFFVAEIGQASIVYPPVKTKAVLVAE